MLYKQAWNELKNYIKIVKVTTTSWDSPEEEAMRDKILGAMEGLEKRWKTK